MRFLVLLPLFFSLSACDQTVKTDSSDTSAPEDTSVAGYQVDVVADGQTVAVDLSTLTTTSFEGDDVVALTTVLDSSALGVTWSERTYDFIASDGYKPSGNDCPPLDYSTVQGGYIYPDSGNVVWDASLGLFGCYFVDGTVTIDVQDAR